MLGGDAGAELVDEEQELEDLEDGHPGQDLEDLEDLEDEDYEAGHGGDEGGGSSEGGSAGTSSSAEEEEAPGMKRRAPAPASRKARSTGAAIHLLSPLAKTPTSGAQGSPMPSLADSLVEMKRQKLSGQEILAYMQTVRQGGGRGPEVVDTAWCAGLQESKAWRHWLRH